VGCFTRVARSASSAIGVQADTTGDGIALAGIALAGIALAGIALAGIALAGIALAGIALAGIALALPGAMSGSIPAVLATPGTALGMLGCAGRTRACRGVVSRETPTRDTAAEWGTWAGRLRDAASSRRDALSDHLGVLTLTDPSSFVPSRAG
jgi:hypothetical protein